MLADLKMPGALEAVDGILAEPDSGTISAAEAIEELLNAQIVLRNNRRLQTAMRSSQLPAVKTLDQFDFADASRRYSTQTGDSELASLDESLSANLTRMRSFQERASLARQESESWSESRLQVPASPKTCPEHLVSCARVSTRLFWSTDVSGISIPDAGWRGSPNPGWTAGFRGSSAIVPEIVKQRLCMRSLAGQFSLSGNVRCLMTKRPRAS